jgi:hypothetical protein
VKALTRPKLKRKNPIPTTIPDTNDAQGTRDRQIQYIFQHEQQQAVEKMK